MDHNYSVEYNSIILRPLGEGDIEFLRNWRNDSENSRYLSKIPYITSQMQKEWFGRYLKNKDELCFAIYEKNELNRVVGSISLYDLSSDRAELGKLLIGDTQAHGKGIGLDSVKALMKIAFENMGLKRIILHVYSQNKPAYTIYCKAGFKVEDRYIKDDMEELLMSINKEK